MYFIYFVATIDVTKYIRVYIYSTAICRRNRVNAFDMHCFRFSQNMQTKGANVNLKLDCSQIVSSLKVGDNLN